jgi:hypothetical protein
MNESGIVDDGTGRREGERGVSEAEDRENRLRTLTAAYMKGEVSLEELREGEKTLGLEYREALISLGKQGLKRGIVL